MRDNEKEDARKGGGGGGGGGRINDGGRSGGTLRYKSKVMTANKNVY